MAHGSGLVEPCSPGAPHTPCRAGEVHPTADAGGARSETAADPDLYARVNQQAAWVSVVVATAAGAVDPQDWLFAERARFQRTGRCDPWAEQMLMRAGLFPSR